MDQPRDSKLDKFVESVHIISRHMRRNSCDAVDENAITRTQWMILRVLWRHDGCTIGHLAERLEVRPSTMSQMIDRLELAGLVYREPDKKDARTRIVRLSEAGVEKVQKVREVRGELLAAPFSQLTSEEQETLIELMHKITHQLMARHHGD